MIGMDAIDHNLIRMANIILVLACFVTLSLIVKRRRVLWTYVFPLYMWLANVLAFYIFILLRDFGVITSGTTILNIWSNVIRMQVLLTIFIASLIMLKEFRDNGQANE